jgi:hypothetical protein
MVDETEGRTTCISLAVSRTKALISHITQPADSLHVHLISSKKSIILYSWGGIKRESGYLYVFYVLIYLDDHISGHSRFPFDQAKAARLNFFHI